MYAIIHRLLILLSICSCFFLVALKISAYETSPSYIVINGKPTTLNIVHAFAHNPGFNIATNLAPNNSYLIGASIQFAINTKKYFTPENTQSEFKWDFQDGTEPIYGNQTSHAFSTAGSHFVNIFARNSNQARYTLADTVQINVIPSENYQLPIAKITVDGKLITDFRSKNQIQPKKNVQFDCSQSVGNNLRCYWELGDGTRSREKLVSHRYSAMGENTYFVVLRVSDDQNIVNDSIVTLNSAAGEPKDESSNYFIGLFRYFSDIAIRMFSSNKNKN